MLQEQQQLQLMYGGGYRGLANQLVKNYYFHTPAQIADMVVPTAGAPRSADPISDLHSWSTGLARDGYVRGDQALIRQQGLPRTRRVRAIGQTFTRELRHPLTGEQTNFVNLSYMPAYPTKTQTDIALHQAELHGAQRRNVDNDLYWRAANQSFRHQPRK